jgi:predicted ATPase
LGAQAYWTLGYPDRALTIGNEALALAERIAHPFSLQVAQNFIAILHLDRREPELGLHWLAAAEALSAEQRLAFMMEPQFLHGAALTAQGAFEEAVACLREGLAGGRRAMLFRPYGLAGLAEALTQQGQHGAALAAAREGLQVQAENGICRWGAELHRLEGIALIGLNLLEEAQSAFEEALRVARHQQAKSYELRAATDLARLLGEQGRRADAHELLAPVYGWFTEGFDTADLKEAKALLAELA